MRPIASNFLFDGQIAKPPGRGINFTVATFYIPLSRDGSAVQSLHIQGDGTAVATGTVQHTDFRENLDGTPIDPTVAGTASNWQTDTAIGTLSIAASATETGQARTTYSNQPHEMSRLVLVVTVAGRIRGRSSGVS